MECTLTRSSAHWEDPPPDDGVPHPLFGEGLTAEQIYQAQLHNWMAQNVAVDHAMHQANQANDNVVVDQQVQFQAQWGAWPAPPPPAVYNFQAWLAAEGLQVSDGILPENNLLDSPAMAWNDSISWHNSSESSVSSDGFVLVPVNILNNLWRSNFDSPASTSLVPIIQQQDSLTIDLSLNNSGLHFTMSHHGNLMASMLFHSARPVRQINDFLWTVIKPIMATFGPWSLGLGFRDCLKVHVDVYRNNDSFVISVGHQITRDNEDCISVVHS